MPSIPQLFAEGLQHHRAGRIAEAERLYRTILEAAPRHGDALNLLGLAATQQGRPDLAEALIGNALAVAPARGDYHANLGNALYAAQKIREGSERYKHALFHAFLKRVPLTFEDLLYYADHPPTPYAGRNEDVALYRSQTLQDLFLDRWVFRGLTGGTFIDIGAHDGVTFSNSHFFEAVRNWRGACIEPNPSVFKRLVLNRPQTRALDCCVSDIPGSAEFLKLTGYAEMLSGMAGKYDPAHKERIAKELKQYGGSSESITVAARTFGDIAAEMGYSEVTYVSIDTEGGETDILKSIDFSRIRVHALTVESNSDSAPMLAFMQANGFEMVKSMGVDLLFLNRSSPFYAAYDRLRRS
jgi:FkbM family methyltransferase